MTKDLLIFLIVMGWTLIITGGITYLIVKKKEYGLVSGFSNRPKDEQEYLIENGYIDKIGKLLLYTFYSMVLVVILTVFRVPYGMEIGFGLLMVIVLGGLVYVQRFEVPRKRKKYTWIYGISSFVIIGLIVGVYIIGNLDNEVSVEEGQLIITGMYGVEWDIKEIEEIELLDKLPEVLSKKDGFNTDTVRKGNFELEEPYGEGRLYVKGENGPFLYVRIKDDYVIINRESSQEIKGIYELLREEMN
ncbi:DUF3784 domain-containing protein [Ornithinibacillus scapharcae]|uniref:DUF3784 domain-containing protein n=1 Tax=Ornithinibacillus scapharcae TaxID=1147159 RepID=UPI000225AFED|nr:DUF3784 domain-containing protein [Ornithinibacillus scapharcae]